MYLTTVEMLCVQGSRTRELELARGDGDGKVSLPAELLSDGSN